MARRVIVAVVAGYVANVLLITGAEQMLSRFVTPARYLVADVVTQCIIQIGCGYLCSRIAKAERLTATVILILVGLLIGSVSVGTSWRSEPHWYLIALLCVYAPCVWIGHRLEQHSTGQ
jgi:hypothetical protein